MGRMSTVWKCGVSAWVGVRGATSGWDRIGGLWLGIGGVCTSWCVPVGVWGGHDRIGGVCLLVCGEGTTGLEGPTCLAGAYVQTRARASRTRPCPHISRPYPHLSGVPARAAVHRHRRLADLSHKARQVAQPRLPGELPALEHDVAQMVFKRPARNLHDLFHRHRVPLGDGKQVATWRGWIKCGACGVARLRTRTG
eukprot:351348-Chlamydomonas_euryale.AAC.4